MPALPATRRDVARVGDCLRAGLSACERDEPSIEPVREHVVDGDAAALARAADRDGSRPRSAIRRRTAGLRRRVRRKCCRVPAHRRWPRRRWSRCACEMALCSGAAALAGGLRVDDHSRYRRRRGVRSSDIGGLACAARAAPAHRPARSLPARPSRSRAARHSPAPRLPP